MHARGFAEQFQQFQQFPVAYFHTVASEEELCAAVESLQTLSSVAAHKIQCFMTKTAVLFFFGS
jgi:hypothetical protein